MGRRGGSLTARLFRVLGAGTEILAYKVLAGALLEPIGELGQLLSQAADGLRVHVGLGNELGERHWGKISEMVAGEHMMSTNVPSSRQRCSAP